MLDTRRCYDLLGLAPGASKEQVKQAYHDLVKVWHPDRFSHDLKLQAKAQEKLKEINEAYEAILSGKTGARRPEAPAPAKHSPHYHHEKADFFPWLISIVTFVLAVALVALALCCYEQSFFDNFFIHSPIALKESV